MKRQSPKPIFLTLRRQRWHGCKMGVNDGVDPGRVFAKLEIGDGSFQAVLMMH
jgi:hypothetical protein